MEIPYEFYKLKNGMQIVLIPYDDVYSFVCGSVSKYGSVLEIDDTRGITHFVEHMTLAATEKYPKSTDIDEAIELRGGSYNASTSLEEVSVYSVLPYTSLELGIDLLDQALYKATFPDDKVERERKVILDEISKSEDQIARKIWNFEQTNSMKKKSAYQYNPLGTKESVASFTTEQLRDYYKKIFQPQNTFIYINGNFDIKIAKELIKSTFEKYENIDAQMSKYPNEQINTNLVLAKKDKKTELVHFTHRFAASDISIFQDEYKHLKMSIIMGALIRSGKSRLSMRLREKEGLLYSMGSSLAWYDPFGYVDFYFRIEKEKFKKCFKIYLEEVKKFIDEGITQEEFEYQKTYRQNGFIMNRDTKAKNASAVRDSIINNYKYYTVESLNDDLKKMTLKEVNQFIKDEVDPISSNYFLYGDVDKDLKDFVAGLKGKYE